VRGIGRRQIAALAEVVNEEAERGDAVAMSCIQRAADELAEVARDVIGELQMARLSFPVIAIGSVARNCRLWWARVCERIAEAAPGMKPIVPALSPAAGAALIALREMGVEWTGEVLRRLTRT
jgi:N-acetylglucosamine kinase-like BadF-type ATPase